MAGRTDSGSSITNVAATAPIATVSGVLSGKRTKDDDIARRVRAGRANNSTIRSIRGERAAHDVTNTIGLRSFPTPPGTVRRATARRNRPDHRRGSQQLLLGIGHAGSAWAERIESLIVTAINGRS